MITRAAALLAFLEREASAFSRQVLRRTGDSSGSDDVLNAMSHAALKHDSVRKYLDKKSASDSDFDKEVASHAGKSASDIHHDLHKAAKESN